MLCENCHKHKGTIDWVGDAGVMGFVHGFSQKWCVCCTLYAQIENIEKMTRRLPSLARKLAKTKCS